MPNIWEDEVIQYYLTKGYDVITIGKPDLICLRGNEIRFVEVKGPKDRLNVSQEHAIGLLRKHGFPVSIEGPGGFMPEEVMMKPMPRAKMKDRLRCLTSRENQYLEALKKYDNCRWRAAQELGVTEHAVASTLSRIRKKMDDAKLARRRYKKILKRQR